jgi:hypothetical protein
MNRSLPRGGRGSRGAASRRASRFGRAVPGFGRLVRGASAAARTLRIGQRWATFGARSLGLRRVGLDAKAGVNWRGAQAIARRRRKPATACAGRASKRTVENRVALLQGVCDLMRDSIVAVDSARPDLVEQWAKDRIVALLNLAHPVAKIAAGEIPRLAYRADDRYWLVVGRPRSPRSASPFPNRSRAGAGSQIRYSREWSVPGSVPSGISPCTTINHSERDAGQGGSAGPTKKARRGRSRAGREEGIRC